MSDQMISGAFRVGHGYDLHRLDALAPDGKGRPFVLGGVRIESAIGPVGHSDADVLMHAATDALLGAIGSEDIGQLFPDDEARHEGEDSRVYLEEAIRRVRAMGYGLVNLDATVVCERPKLKGHKAAIRENLARVLGVEVGAVNVKGKTHEGVDAIGEGRAIEAHCVALIARV